MTSGRFFATACVLTLCARPAAAQARSRSGFWMDGVAGWSRLKLVCRTCSDDVHARGTMVTLALGGTPARTVLLGVEAQLWSGSDAGVGQRVRSVALVAQWYPWRSGFYVRGGTGLANGRVAPADTAATHTAVRGRGISISLAAGYDLAVSRQFALTAQAASQVTALGDLVLPGHTADDTVAYLTRLSVGLTLR